MRQTIVVSSKRSHDPQVIAFGRAVGVQEQNRIAVFVFECFQSLGEGVTLAPFFLVEAAQHVGASFSGYFGRIVVAIISHQVQAESVPRIIAGEDFFRRLADNFTFIVAGNYDSEKRYLASHRCRRLREERPQRQRTTQ